MIEVKNLTKKFNSFIAVDNISFSIQKGEIFAFLGPNGAGKTTTIRMLTTLLKPTVGEIKINGFDPQREKNKVRESISPFDLSPCCELIAKIFLKSFTEEKKYYRMNSKFQPWRRIDGR